MRAALALVVFAACSSHGGGLGGGGGEQPDAGSGSGSGSGSGDPNLDSDGDGVNDAIDNCPAIANADQRDHDGDGRGDACDVCPHIADTGADFDGDGVGDACDPNPTTPGERIALFDGFYGPLDPGAWQVVGGASSWQISNGKLVQPATDGAHAIVHPQTPAPNNVFVEARIRVDGVTQTPGARRSIAIAAGYQAPTDFWFCGVAATFNGSEIEAGRVDPGPATGNFNFSQADFAADMTSDWLTLQARTAQAAGQDTHLDCTGHMGTADATTGYDASNDAAGEIGVRTNGVAASFDYLFVVEVPPPPPM